MTQSVVLPAVVSASTAWTSIRESLSSLPSAGGAHGAVPFPSVGARRPAGGRASDPRPATNLVGHAVPLSPPSAQAEIGERIAGDPERRVLRRPKSVAVSHGRKNAQPAAPRMVNAASANTFTTVSRESLGRGRIVFRAPSGFARLSHRLTEVNRVQRADQTNPLGIPQVQPLEREAVSSELVLRKLPAPVSETVRPISDIRRAPEEDVYPQGAAMVASRSQPPSLTLTSASTVRIDRAPTDGQQRASATQQAETSRPGAGHQEQGDRRELDLDNVSRQVYDWILQRLTIERERAGYP